MPGDKQVVNELRNLQSLIVNSVNLMMEITEKQTDTLLTIKDYLSEGKDGKGGEKTAKGNESMSFKEIVKEFGNMATVLPVFVKSLRQFEKVNTEKFNTFLQDMTKAMTNDGTLDPKGVAELYTSMGEVFVMLGGSVGKLSFGLMAFTLADKMGGTTAFIGFTQKFFNADMMAKLDPTKAQGMGDALYAIGRGLLMFSASLALSTPLIILGIPALLIGIPVFMGLMAFFSLINSKKKETQGGADSMMYMGIGLIAFSAALLIMRFVPPEAILKSIAVIGVFTLFVVAMGLAGRLTGGGAAGLKQLGGGILIASAGLAVFALTLYLFKGLEFEDVMKGGIAMLMLAGGVALIGMAKKDVLFGSLALIVASAAIGIMGYVIKEYYTDETTWEGMAKAGLVLGALTVSLLLLSNPMVLIGAAALAIVALSFSYSFGLIMDGLVEFKQSGWADADTAVLKNTIAGILTSVSSVTEGKGLLGGLGAIFGGAAGTGMLAVIGLTMKPFVEGLNNFKKAGITQADAENVGLVISTIINKVKDPIEAIGSTGGFFSDTDFENGIESIEGLGDLMADLAKGVLAMSSLEFKSLDGTIVKLNNNDFVNAGKNISSILNSIKDPIMEFGSTTSGGNKSGGILDKMMNYFSEPDFENGMEATAGLGDLMKELAEGVLKMSSLEFKSLDGKIVKLGPADFIAAGKSIASILNAVKDPIMEFGSTVSGGNKSGSTLDKLMNYFSEPDFENGMEAASGLGEFMKELAEGVLKMSSLEFKSLDGKTIVKLGDADFARAGENIKRILTVVKDPIMEIGRTSSAGGGEDGTLSKVMNYFSDSDFQNGMESVTGLGTFMKELAEGVLKMSSLEFKSLDGKIVKLGPADFERAGVNIKRILTAVKDPISEIGKSGGFITDSDFKKGMDSIKGLGAEMAAMADGVIKMAAGVILLPTSAWKDKKDLTEADYRAVNQTDFDNAGKFISSLLHAVSKPISDLGAGGGIFTDSNFQNGMDAIKGLDKVIAGLTDSMIKVAQNAAVLGPPAILEARIYGMVKAAIEPIAMGGQLAAKFNMDDGTDAVEAATDTLATSGKDIRKFFDSVSGIDFEKQFPALMGTFVKGLNKFGDLKLENAERARQNFVSIGATVATIANSANPLQSAATSIEKISEAWSKMITVINGSDMMNLKNTALLFEQMVNIEKVNADTLAKKLEAYKKYVEEVEKISSEKSVKMFETSDEAAAQRFKNLEDNMKSMVELLGATVQGLNRIASRLGQTLNVDVVNDGSTRKF